MRRAQITVECGGCGHKVQRLDPGGAFKLAACPRCKSEDMQITRRFYQ